MGRPPRASAASTRIVGFRLTEDEERRLDELVTEQGHKDRSALLRAWLAQGGPASTTGANSPSIVTFAKNEPRAHSRPRDTSARPPSTSTTQRAPNSPPSTPTPRVFEQVLSVLRREHEHDPHLGLISIVKVVRSLAPVPVHDVHAALLALHERSTIELRPEAGSEFLHDDDAALCPPGPRGTVFSFARWTERTDTTSATTGKVSR